MKANEKIKIAVGIFKTSLPKAQGKFRAIVSGTNSNEVDFMCDEGLYCSINIRTGKIRGI
ncbi:MAG: hypothetical protein FWC08_13375 [Defluviitaleaceae bacterium]|nr:hypothetical protein [Defluviitaleaceae bacterium]